MEARRPAGMGKGPLFLILAYGFSWTLLALYLLLGGRWQAPWSTLVLVAYMFGPLAAALVVQRAVYREPVRAPLRISFRLNRWFLVAWFLPVGLALATLGISLLLPGIRFSPDMAGMVERFRGLLTAEQLRQMQEQITRLPVHPFWLTLVQGLLAGATVNAVAAFGEELGWRGLLLRTWEGLGFWRASLVTGLAWGFWHAPVILLGHNFPQHRVAGIFVMTVGTTLLAPLLSYVTLRAKSVVAAAVAHGTFNATAGLAILVIRGGTDLTTGVFGLPGLVALALANLAIFVYDRVWSAEPLMGGFAGNPKGAEKA
ncbi:MAG: lysostaphin resistance A-like protein [Chitinophagales bacterium]